MNAEKGIPVENFGEENNNNDQLEHDESSISSSVPTARTIHIQVESPLTNPTSLSAARPPRSPSPSVSESTSTARTLRSTISPISTYFQAHEPLASYQSDRETTVFSNSDSGTLSETHILRNEGLRDVYYTEEHWSSVIKSYVTNVPPKFKQIIKAYRCQPTDKLTLFVEVISQPPAIFQWFCNDRPATGDILTSNGSKKFEIRHGTNVSTLTVEGPDQGVYSCSAQNPAGVSKSYGYITVNDSKSYKDVEQTEATIIPQKSTKRRPKFLSQIPHFVLRPSDEALIDVEVDSAPPVKFSWFVDGKQIRGEEDNVVFYSPTPTRCVAQFQFPTSGQYTVVAQNEFGATKSSGFIEVQKDPMIKTHLHLLQPQKISPLPPQVPRANLASNSRHGTTRTTIRTTTYVHRASSLPLTQCSKEEENTQHVRKSQTPERVQDASLNEYRTPHPPVFVTQLPKEIILQLNEKLVLKTEVVAVPNAEFAWKVDGESVERLDSFKILTETNRSTLVVEPPVHAGSYGVTAANTVGSITSNGETLVRHSENDQWPETQDEITQVIVKKEEVIEEDSDSESENNDESEQIFVKTYTDSLYSQNRIEVEESVEDQPISLRSLVPTIVCSPERRIFVPGGLPLILELRVASTSSAIIRWYYRNFELRSGNDINIETGEPNYSRVTYENPPEGVYKAVVTNEFGIANFETQVLVEFTDGRKPFSSEKQDIPLVEQPNKSQNDISTKNQPEETIYTSELKERISLKPEPQAETQLVVADSAKTQLETTSGEPQMTTQETQSITAVSVTKSVLTNLDEKQQISNWKVTNQSSVTELEENIDLLKEDFTETTNLQKQEETYCILVNVAESLAQTLVVNVFISAVEEAAKNFFEPETIESEEEDFDIVNLQRQKPSFLSSNLNEENPPDVKELEDVNLETVETVLFIKHDEEKLGVSVLLEIPEKFSLSSELSKRKTREKNEETKKTEVVETTSADENRQIDSGIKQESSINLDPNLSTEKLKTDSAFETENIKQYAPIALADDFHSKTDDEITSKELEESSNRLAEDLKILELELANVTKTPLDSDNALTTDNDDDYEKISIDTKRLNDDSVDDEDLSKFEVISDNYSLTDFDMDITDVDLHFRNHEQLYEIVVGIVTDVIESTKETIRSKNLSSKEPTKGPIEEDRYSEDDVDMVKISPIHEQQLKSESDSSTTEQKGTGLTESISSLDSMEAAYYAQQQQLLRNTDFPDNLSTSTCSTDQVLPIFYEPLYNNEFDVGTRAQLKCVVGGNPTPEIMWFVDDDQIIENEDYKVIYEDGVCLLRFNNVIPEDEGEYVCVAYNSVGKAFTKCFIKVDAISNEIMHHLADNFIFRKIKRFRKTQSSKTIRSLDNKEFQFFEYEQEPSIRTPSYMPTSTSEGSSTLFFDPIIAENISNFDKEENIVSTFLIERQIQDSEYLTHSVKSSHSCISMELNESISQNSDTCSQSKKLEVSSLLERNEIEDVTKSFTPSLDITTSSSSTPKLTKSIANTKDVQINETVINNPRELALPDKVMFRGERINVKISGPVHFLTANIHQHTPQSDHVHPKTQEVEEKGSANNIKLLEPMEKYADALCNISDIFLELDRKINDNASNDKTFEKKLIQNFQNSSKSKPENSLQKLKKSTSSIDERPGVSPYLVQSNSYCHLSRIVNIAQEWRLSREALVGKVNGLFCSNRVSHQVAATIKLQSQTSGRPNSTKFDDDTDTSTIVRKKKLDSNLSLACQENPANIEEYENLRRTIKDVENNLRSARRCTYESRNREAKLIEKAILDISERLTGQHEPLTRAQAEANEELLKTRLAEMILNIGSDEEGVENNYDYAMLKEPLHILKNKLNFLEQFFEEEDSIKDELSTITQLPVSSRKSNTIQQRERSLKKRGEDIARMTPLISVVKNKLVDLEKVVQVNEKERRFGRTTPYQERRTVHDLLYGINMEINTIHSLCRQNSGLESLNTVINVLSKMCSSLDKILEALRDYSIEKRKKSVGENNNVDVCCSCHLMLEKEEESEAVTSFIIRIGNAIHSITPKIRVKRSIQLPRMQPKSKTLEQSVSEQKHIMKKNQPPKHFPITKELLDVSHFNATKPNENNPQITMSSTTKNLCTTDHICKSNTLGVPMCKYQAKGLKCYQPDSPTDIRISIGLNLKRPEQLITVMKTFPVKMMYVKLQQYVPDEGKSMHMICEDDSTITSRCVRHRPSTTLNPCFPHENCESSEFGDASSFISDDSPVSFLKAENDMPELDLRQVFDESPNAAKRRQLKQRLSNEGDSLKLLEKSERIQNVVEQKQYFEPDNCSQRVSIIINDEESFSETITQNFPILFRKTSSVSNYSKANSERETAILSDEDESSAIHIYDQRTSCTETFDLRKRSKRAVLSALVYPDVKAEIRATLTTDTFQIDVERMSETGRESVVMVSEEFYSKKIKINRKSNIENIYIDVPNIASEKQPNNNNDSDDTDDSLFVDTLTKLNVSIMARSVRDSIFVHLEEIPCGEAVINLPGNKVKSKDIMNVSNISLQTNDTLVSSEATLGATLGSVVSNIIVAENQDEARSLVSHRSITPKSIETEKTLSLADVDNIPAYIIKQGSTASITCELNTYVNQNSSIVWYCGKKPIDIQNQKYDRICHDLLEVLVILKVDLEDGQLYSIKVNGEIYPVAYLIVEDGYGEEKYDKTLVKETILALQSQKPCFISPPQTMFVMQGQTAILSCQMNCPNLDILWFQEQEPIHDGNDDRIFFEKTPNAWYRILIEDVDFMDQGTYYVYYQENSTSINLIVEERIDEREVQVSSAETDDDELSDYLVPIGSTATIACELDNASTVFTTENGSQIHTHHQLYWQRNNYDIVTSEVGVGTMSRFEHVQNDNKHYLIIHNAQPADSGVYSVRVNGTRFKVAQITIGDHKLLSQKSGNSQCSISSEKNGSQLQRHFSSGRIKRISNSSLVQETQ